MKCHSYSLKARGTYTAVTTINVVETGVAEDRCSDDEDKCNGYRCGGHEDRCVI